VIKIGYRGRLGNRMIQFAAGHILATKTGLTLSSSIVFKYKNTDSYRTTFDQNKTTSINFLDIFKIKLPTGQSYPNAIKLDDINYYQHLNNPLENTGYKLNGFFQDGRLLCAHRDDILKLYQYTKKPTIDISKDDAFFACRFGDCLKNGRTYCSIEYIEEELKINRHNYRNIYVTSDSLNYPPLVKLMDEYNINLYNNDPLKTILFAKNFNNLILSAGSFSYWMAYLSEATNITVYKNTEQDPLQKQNAWSYNKNVKFSL
jgi:hypothetical protein